MLLAWRNLTFNRTRLCVTVTGVAFAVFLMVFQASLLAGFLCAASEVIEAADADLWITARGVPCFDFSAPVPERYRAMASAVPGVESVDRVASRLAAWKKPSGVEQTVIVVGADPGGSGVLPRPIVDGRPWPEGVVVDRSDLEALGLHTIPEQIEIGGRRARVTGVAEGFASFIGSPYVFTSHADALDYTGFAPHQTTFLLVHVRSGQDPERVRAALARKLDDTDVWTTHQFIWRSRLYWVLQTGAGGAILIAGLLGFVVGVLIVSQAMSTMTLESIEEFATLKAIGASSWYVRRVVVAQALMSGLAGALVGLALALPAIAGLRTSIPWVQTPSWLPALMILSSLLMSTLASVVSVRKAVNVEPGRVFRV